MKNYMRYALITVILVGLSAAPAHADDEAWAAVGGFVAGIITGASIDNHDNHRYDSGVRVSVGSRHYPSNTRYDRHRSYRGHSGVRYETRRHSGGRGHYTYRKVRVWVPGRWDFVRNHCGDHVRVWKDGYYNYRTEKVWVSSSRRGYRH